MLTREIVFSTSFLDQLLSYFLLLYYTNYKYYILKKKENKRDKHINNLYMQ